MFLYEIGQVLQLRVAPTWRLQVIERLASECSAGEQRYYLGRLYEPKWGLRFVKNTDRPDTIIYEPMPDVVKYHEIELEPVPQADANRNMPELFKCRDLVPVLGVSAEPLLGPISFSSADCEWWESANQPFWVIVGCESGPGRRPMQAEWAASIADQCRSVGVPCFIKQMEVGGKVTHDVNMFPQHLRVRMFPGEGGVVE